MLVTRFLVCAGAITALAVSGCERSLASEAVLDAGRVELGLITQARAFERSVRVTNGTDIAWEIDSVKTSCGCIKVLDYTKSVGSGETLNLRLRVSPEGRSGSQQSQVLLSCDKRDVRLTLSGFFMSGPFAVNDGMEIVLPGNSDKFSAEVMLCGGEKEGTPVVASRTDSHSLEIRLAGVDQDRFKMQRGVHQYTFTVKGTMPVSAEIINVTLPFEFTTSHAVVTSRFQVRRKLSVTWSPRVVLIDSKLAVGKSVFVRFEAREDVVVEQVRVNGANKTLLTGRVRDDAVELQRVAKAGVLRSGTFSVALVLSNGRSATIPCCVVRR